MHIFGFQHNSLAQRNVTRRPPACNHHGRVPHAATTAVALPQPPNTKKKSVASNKPDDDGKPGGQREDGEPHQRNPEPNYNDGSPDTRSGPSHEHNDGDKAGRVGQGPDARETHARNEAGDEAMADCDQNADNECVLDTRTHSLERGSSIAAQGASKMDANDGDIDALVLPNAAEATLFATAESAAADDSRENTVDTGCANSACSSVGGRVDYYDYDCGCATCAIARPINVARDFPHMHARGELVLIDLSSARPHRARRCRGRQACPELRELRHDLGVLMLGVRRSGELVPPPSPDLSTAAGRKASRRGVVLTGVPLLMEAHGAGAPDTWQTKEAAAWEADEEEEVGAQ